MIRKGPLAFGVWLLTFGIGVSTLLFIVSKDRAPSIPQSSPQSSAHDLPVSPELPELVIYTTQSFVAREGLGPVIFPSFEKKCQCRLKVVAIGDTGQFVTRLQLDSQQNRPTADLLVGIDQQSWDFIRPWAESLANLQSGELPGGGLQGGGLEGVEAIHPWLLHATETQAGFLPMDYGTFSWMVDREKADDFLKSVHSLSLHDLLRPEWRRSFLLEDPRTSGVGLGFLLFTREILGNSAWEFWKQFRNQWLTLTPGWVGAYGLFLKGEAPLVWSYVTSQAYHESQGEHHRYQALLFQEGQPYQIEGATLIRKISRSSEQARRAREFLEYLISPEIQSSVPTLLWMMPARKDVELPESFKKLPQPSRLIPLPSQRGPIQESLARWREAIQ